MITRDDVLSQACVDCMKDLYSFAYPKVTWEDFKKENEVYNKKYKTWENFDKAFQEKDKNPEIWLQYQSTFKDWENKSITECIGPKPFEFYFLPREIMKSICEEYIYAYRIDLQQELLNTIDILKDYCRKPIVDKYIDEHTDENGDWHPGYRSYDHPDNLEKEIKKKLEESPIISVPPSNKEEYYTELSEKLQDKFFEFLDMAGNFYNWNRDLNSFNMTVYLGASPNSNKEAVIKNWKEYRNKDIEIDEEQIKREYYGEDELD